MSCEQESNTKEEIMKVFKMYDTDGTSQTEPHTECSAQIPVGAFMCTVHG